MKFGFDWPMMDKGACLYYKLTYESSGSDELKIQGFIIRCQLCKEYRESIIIIIYK